METKEIAKRIEKLPDHLQKKVFDFIDLLEKTEDIRGTDIPFFIDKPISIKKLIIYRREEIHER